MPAELRYCEKCGDIIQLQEGESADVAEQFVCESCQGGGSGKPAARAASGEAVDLGEKSGELDLFSTKTISFHQREFESLAMKHDDGPLKQGAAPAARREPGDGDHHHPLTLVDGESPSQSQAQSQPQPQGSATGGAAPAPTARRIVFRCMHCRATLSIRPVKSTSRLSCPYCSKHIYVTQSGQLIAKPPSVVLRQGSAALPKIRPGSVALKREPDAGETAETREREEKDAAGPRSSSASSASPSSPGGSRRDRKGGGAGAVEELPPEPHPRSFTPPGKAGGPSVEEPPAGGISGFDEDLRTGSPAPAGGKARSAGGAARPPTDARARTPDERPERSKPASAQRPAKLRRPATSSESVEEDVTPIGRRPGRQVASPPAAESTLGQKLLQGFFVAFTLTLPVILLGVTDQIAGARGFQKPSESPPTVFDKLGNVALRGMQDLLENEER